MSGQAGTRGWMESRRIRRSGDYAGAMIGNIIALVLFNLYPLWRPLTAGVVTDRWEAILWAVDLSLLLQIGGNFILVFRRPRWLRHLLEIAFSATGLLSAAVFFAVFPLDFSPLVGAWLDTLMRVLLVLGMAGAAIGVVVGLVRLLTSFAHPEE
jgi:hypothetical protein